MTWLYGLWLVSVALSALAMLIMIGLILARVVSNRRDRTSAAERRRLVPLLLAAERCDALPVEGERAGNLLTDLSTELVQLVRGTDKERFVASASRVGVPERLRHRMVTGSPRARMAAAEALAEFGDPASIEQLRQALDDANADVRLTAAVALATAGEAPPARVLIEKLGIGSRENSLLIIGLFRDIARQRPEEIKELVQDDSADPAVRMAAVEALSDSGDYSLVPLITELAMWADPLGEELPRYLRALGHLGHPVGAPAVEYGLGCEAWEARAAAALAAGRIGLIGAAERLGTLLDDPQWWVRFRAGEALAALGAEGHRLLLEKAKSGSTQGSSAARLTLAERGLSP